MIPAALPGFDADNAPGVDPVLAPGTHQLRQKMGEAVRAYFDRETSHKARGALEQWMSAQERHDAVDSLAALMLESARDQRADNASAATVHRRACAGELETIRDELTQISLPGYAKRRDIEKRLADRLDKIPGHVWLEYNLSPAKMAEKTESMRMCHTQGTVGIKEHGAGDHLVMWDHKCRDSRLCPDEAREEQRRVSTSYTPALLQWQKAKPGRRVLWCVLTLPNAPAGELRPTMSGESVTRWNEKKGQDEKISVPGEIWGRFRERILDARRPVTDLDRKRYEYGARKKTVPQFAPGMESKAKRLWKQVPGFDKPQFQGDGLHGALCSTEAPVSASGEWNVHMNVFLLWQGPCDFAELRAAWGHNLHIDADIIDCTDARSLANGFVELVKYGAEHTASKSGRKAYGKPEGAPPMLEWTDAQLAEWIAAHKRYRRLRGYGVLHGIGKPESEDSSGIVFVGTVEFGASHTYLVDLIQADNSGRSFVVPTHNEARSWINQLPDKPPDRR